MFIATQTDANCYGQVYPAYPANIPSYTSTDFGICNPHFATGETTGISPGLATISASWTGDAWFMNIGEYCDYTPVQAVRDAICEVLNRDVQYKKVRFSNKSADFSSFNYTATLDIGTATGGTSACAGGASNPFTIYIDFDMPPGASAILHPDQRTFVTDNDNQQFRLVSFGFENEEFTINQRATMRITLSRRPAKPSNRVDFNIAGTSSGQTGIWSGAGRVHLQCP